MHRATDQQRTRLCRWENQPQASRQTTSLTMSDFEDFNVFWSDPGPTDTLEFRNDIKPQCFLVV